MNIASLIENVRTARAHHDFLFDENDHGRAPDSAVQDAIEPIDEAFLALCRARPINLDDQQLRAVFLTAELFEYIENCEAITRSCIAAFVEPDACTDLQTLMAAHDAALAAYDAEQDGYDKEDDATGRAVDAARDALLDHRPGSLAEVAAKVAYMASQRTFTEWDDFDQRRLIEALVPEAVAPTVSALPARIEAHKSAWVDFDAACAATDAAAGTDAEAAAAAAQDKAGDAVHDALYAILDYQYATVAELKQAINYLADHHTSTGDGDPSHWCFHILSQIAGIEEDGQ